MIGDIETMSSNDRFTTAAVTCEADLVQVHFAKEAVAGRLVPLAPQL